MKRPEYVAVVTGVYRALLDERRGPPRPRSRSGCGRSSPGTGLPMAISPGARGRPCSASRPSCRWSRCSRSNPPGAAELRPGAGAAPGAGGRLPDRPGGRAIVPVPCAMGRGTPSRWRGRCPQPARSRQTRREDVEQSLRKNRRYALCAAAFDGGDGAGAVCPGARAQRSAPPGAGGAEPPPGRPPAALLPGGGCGAGGRPAPPPLARLYGGDGEHRPDERCVFAPSAPGALPAPWPAGSGKGRRSRRCAAGAWPRSRCCPGLSSDGEQLEGVERQLTLARRAGATQALCGNLGQVRSAAPAGDGAPGRFRLELLQFPGAAAGRGAGHRAADAVHGAEPAPDPGAAQPHRYRAAVLRPPAADG